MMVSYDLYRNYAKIEEELFWKQLVIVHVFFLFHCFSAKKKFGLGYLFANIFSALKVPHSFVSGFINCLGTSVVQCDSLKLVNMTFCHNHRSKQTGLIWLQGWHSQDFNQSSQSSLSYYLLKHSHVTERAGLQTCGERAASHWFFLLPVPPFFSFSCSLVPAVLFKCCTI